MKTILGKIIVILLCLIPITAVSATTYTPGVKAEDWAKYVTTDVSWTSTQPGATKPQYIIDAENTEWERVQVATVSVTTITGSSIAHYKNGTEKTYAYSGDIKTGSGNITYVFVGGGLNSGEKINESPSSPSINDTVTRSYAGASRSVNWVGARYVSSVYNATMDFYWDQTTGILCELFVSTSTKSGAYMTTLSQRVVISETNRWAGSFLGLEWWMYIVIAVVVIIAIIVLIFFILRRRKSAQALPITTVTQPPPPPPPPPSP